MKLLKTKIKNFQSLGDVEIVHGDLTVLWGSSDVGKSACIRAIRALHRNTASPNDIRFGKSKLSIEQEFEDGTVIGCEKSKTVNNYEMNDKVFQKVGRDIPEPVLEVLNTGKLILDKDQELDLNFSTQLEGHFLLADSSSLVTKTVSSLSGIHYIYSALREAYNQTQKLKTQAQILESNILPLEKFDILKVDANALLIDLEKIEKVQESLDKIKEEVETLKEFNSRLIDLKKTYIDTTDITKQLESFLWEASKSLELGHQLGLLKDVLLRSKSVKEIDISEILESLQTINFQSNEILTRRNDFVVLKELSGKTRKLKYSDFEANLTEVETIYGKLNTIFLNLEKEKSGYNTSKDVLKRITNSNILDKTWDMELTKLNLEEADLKSKIKLCPACGRVL